MPEDLVIREVDSPIPVTALKTFQWGQTGKWEIGILMTLTFCKPRIVCAFVSLFPTKGVLKVEIII